jgi:uncharacterized protein
MQMSDEVLLPGDRAIIWQMLNNPDILRQCIPGCESLEKVSDTELAATAKIKIGPVSARFHGRVTLQDLDPPNGYRIVGAGEGGIAGFAKGTAIVTLHETSGGTLMKYEVDAQIGGKMAQLGARLIDGVAKKLADQFFARFEELAVTQATA